MVFGGALHVMVEVQWYVWQTGYPAAAHKK